MVSLPGQGPIYIIVDALDECPNFLGRPSAREVLEFVEELVSLKLPEYTFMCGLPAGDRYPNGSQAVDVSQHFSSRLERAKTITSDLLSIQTGGCGDGELRIRDLSSMCCQRRRMACNSSHSSSLVLGLTMDARMIL